MGRAMIRFLLLLLVTTQLTSDAEPPPNPLEGKHLIVVLENFPPATVIERDSSGKVIGYSGPMVEQLDWLSRRLRFEYTMLPWDNSTVGLIKSNKTRNAFGEMIGQLIRQEVDVSLGPFVVRLERQDIGIGCSAGVLAQVLLVRYPPSVEKSIYATVEPFDYKIWVGIGISLLAVAACSWFIIYISHRFMRLEMPVERTAAKIFIYLFKVIVQQGNSYARITRSMGVLAFTWSLIAIVIVNAYNSSVISYLSANYRKPEVSTFKELAENPNYNMLAVKGAVSEYDIATGVTKDLQTVAKKYKSCPDCSIEFNAERMVNKVTKENYVAVLPVLQVLTIIKQFSPNERECKLTMGNDRLSYYHIFFGVPKESPYQVQLRQESLWYIAHGLQIDDSSARRRTLDPKQCLLKYNYKGGQSESVISPIKLKQLFVPFVILICGLLLAFFQLLRELMHAHFERQMTSQVVSAPAATSTKVEIDSPPAEKSVKAPQQGTTAAVADAESKVVIESPLAVVDISNGDPDEHVTSSRPSSPYEIK